MFDMNPLVPSLGASGAISGVLGGYILLFPRNRVTVLMFNFLTEVRILLHWEYGLRFNL
jgi:membrane associated rhomboid family serine protease